MISPSGMFDYVVIVPEDRSEGGFESRAETRGSVVREGPNLADASLVGTFPWVRVTEAGPQGDTGLRPPWSLRKRSRITLVATQDQATVREASFYIDKTLTDCARPGDEMHFSRTTGAGLGFSVIRDEKLIAAAGEITSVPLGIGVEVRIPLDLISTAESVFRKRDPAFEFVEQPVEIKIDGLREQYSQSTSPREANRLTNSFISFGGVAIVGEYRVIVRHGPSAIEDGLSESVSICHKQTFTHAAGEFAAMLLDGPEALSICR